MPFGIDITYVWLFFAVALAIVEISTTTLVCIWFIIGALFAFAASFITDSILLQTVIFAAVSGFSLAFTRPVVEKHLNRHTVPTNADMLVGKMCTVTQPISPQQKGRVVVDGQSWMAASSYRMNPGQQAVIEKIRGVTLIVSPVTVTAV